MKAHVGPSMHVKRQCRNTLIALFIGRDFSRQKINQRIFIIMLETIASASLYASSQVLPYKKGTAAISLFVASIAFRGSAIILLPPNNTWSICRTRCEWRYV